MAIAGVKSFSLGSLGSSALGSNNLRLGPCNAYYGSDDYIQLTGTADRDAVNLKELVGTGTSFTTELKVGDWILFSTTYTGIPYRVVKINSNTSLEVDRDLPSLTGTNIYKTDLIFLGRTDATTLKWKVNKADLKASQEGDSPADRAVVGYEVSIEMGLAEPTLERLDRIVQGFIAQFDSSGNYKGGAFTLPIGQSDSEIANTLHLIRIVKGQESSDVLDHIRIFKAVPVTDSEVKYDASSQLFMKQTFNAYIDRTKKVNGAPVIFVVGDVTFDT
jgi:hypothetical protein